MRATRSATQALSLRAAVTEWTIRELTYGERRRILTAHGVTPFSSNSKLMGQLKQAAVGEKGEQVLQGFSMKYRQFAGSFSIDETSFIRNGALPTAEHRLNIQLAMCDGVAEPITKADDHRCSKIPPGKLFNQSCFRVDVAFGSGEDRSRMIFEQFSIARE